MEKSQLDVRSSIDTEHGVREIDPAKSFLVEWDGPRDAENPRNWSFLKRSGVTSLWVLGNFVACIASSIFSSGAGEIEKEFDVNTTVATLGTSLYVLGYAVGPPIWGPMSELFGRRNPELIGMFVFTLFCLPSALGTNIQTLLIGRFFAGVFGAAPLSIVGGALGDIWDPIQRGVALCTCVGALFGSPTLGPIMGNFMTESHLGWRWNSWLSAIMGLACTIVTLIFLPETSAPTILKRKAARLRKTTGNENYRSAFCGQEKGPKAIFQVYLLRPYAMLLTEPILLFITLQQAFVYGILYLAFTAYPIEFHEIRHWSLGLSSLPYLGLLTGIILGAVVLVVYTITVQAKKTKLNNGIIIPEERLPLMIVGACLMPVGFFIYAWTSMPHVHWSGMVVGSLPLGAGLYMVFVQGFNYIIDVYLANANSAVGGNTFVRSFFGFGFPLFGPVMYHKLGVQWATSLLGFVSIAMIPIPVLFYVYGKTIRGWSKNGMNKN